MQPYCLQMLKKTYTQMLFILFCGETTYTLMLMLKDILQVAIVDGDTKPTRTYTFNFGEIKSSSNNEFFWGAIAHALEKRDQV